MKKSKFTFIAILAILMRLTLFGQEPQDPQPVTTILAPTSTNCGEIDIPVTVQDFTNVGAISLGLNFDPLVFAYRTPAVTVNPQIVAANNSILFTNISISGNFILGFYDYFSSPGQTLDPNAVLFTLHFTLLPTVPSGQTTNLTWSTIPEYREYAGPGGEPVYVISTFTDLTNWSLPVLDDTPPAAICQNLTVQLDANGAVSITAAQIDNGSYDACGIQSLALDVNTFSCADIATNPNPVVLTVTDYNGNVSTCNATVTVIGNPLPVPTITSSTADNFCNGVTLTATSNTLVSQYLWSTGETTQSIFLSSATDDAGSYWVIATDQNGCSSASPAEYIYDPEGLNSSYTIIGFEQVQIGMNNFVQSGSVGLTGVGYMAHVKKDAEVNGAGSFVKADNINIHNTATVLNPIYDPATIILPTMYYNTATGISGTITINANSTTIISTSHKNIKIKENCTVTIEGNVYGFIEIYENCEVTFTGASLDIDRIKIKKADNSSQATIIHFAQDADIRIKEKFEIDEFCTFNPENHKVVCYIGDGMGYDGHFQMNAKGNTFNGSVYVPYGQILIHKDAHPCYPGYLTGFFIANKVHANGKYVYWNWRNCSSALNLSAAVMPLPSESEEFEGQVIKLNTYPNPFSEKVAIEFELAKTDKVKVEIFNITGNRKDVIYNGEAVENRVYKVILDGSQFAAGMYQVKVSSEDQYVIRKIISIK